MLGACAVLCLSCTVAFKGLSPKDISCASEVAGSFIEESVDFGCKSTTLVGDAEHATACV